MLNERKTKNYLSRNYLFTKTNKKPKNIKKLFVLLLLFVFVVVVCCASQTHISSSHGKWCPFGYTDGGNGRDDFMLLLIRKKNDIGIEKGEKKVLVEF